MSIVQKLYNKGLLKCDPFVSNTEYEVIMGSMAYAVNDDDSDMDIYGFCIPPKEIVFPYLAGEIPGFGTQAPKFEQKQEHKIIDKDNKKEYDVVIYNIVKYFQLVMENNPNMIDSLFVPARCIIHSTKIGNMVRENRKMFLCKKAWHSFKGYSYNQMGKMNNKNPIGKRVKIVQEFGYDVRFASHVVRLLLEVEQILTEGDIDLERNRAQIKSIRRGEWKKEQIVEYFEAKEKALEQKYLDCDFLPHKPREKEIKVLLLQCLEESYGTLDTCLKHPQGNLLLIELQRLVSKYS